MLKKYMCVITLLALSITAQANNMSQDPKNSNLTIPTDITESRQRYEKQSRVSYAPKEVEAPKVAKVAEADALETAEPATETTAQPTKKPANPGPSNHSKGRAGAMRF